jgi:hypothetical protein
MKWIKKGLIYEPNRTLEWSKYYGILPTPLYIEKENTLKVFFATADARKDSRVYAICLDPANPSRRLSQVEGPLLDIGEPGCFDDCGVVPSCIFRDGEQHRLYYIGFQRLEKVPYLLLAGLGVWDDVSNQFNRISRTPILERTNDEPYVRSAPTVIKDKGIYKMWYVAASHWETIDTSLFNNKVLPNYKIRYAESEDGLRWRPLNICVDYEHNDEFGFGRPWVIKYDERYYMWYSIRRRKTSYRIGFAHSNDGISWQRRDDLMDFDISSEGWDSEMVCYPAVIQLRDRFVLFYNGNNNGDTGFGYAELPKEEFVV